jgi:KDO2-lipid IV(A) lauroyltransferase
MIVAVAKLILTLLSWLPQRGPEYLSLKLTGLAFSLSPVKRNTTHTNLAACFPELTVGERSRLASDSFTHYVCSVLESGRNWYWPLDRLQALNDEVIGEDIVTECLASGRGIVALAPHFGAWEYLGVYLQKYPDVAIVYKPPSSPALEKALTEKRRRGGANLIPANTAGLRALFAHVRAGKGAGILPDQQPAGGHGQFAPFFGVQALTAVLAPRLIQKTDCHVLLVGCERRPGGRYRIHFMRADEDIYSPDLQTALTAVNRGVERIIAIDPAQYLWSYKRFKARPEGEKPMYS